MAYAGIIGNTSHLACRLGAFLHVPALASEDPVQPIQRLYIDHRNWLQGWLRQRVGNSSDAADLVQETFLSVLNGGALPDIRTPRPFLVTVASRLVLRRRQRRRLEETYLVRMAARPSEVAPSAEAHLLALETLQQLDGALEGLPANARQAFLLAHLEHLSYSDIAQRLKVSTSSVKQYLSKANRCCFFLMSP